MLSGNALGKKAEKFIIKYLEGLGKYVYVARFADTYDANKGRWGDPTQKKTIITRRPCDCMLIWKGTTYFCEIKATTNKKGLTPSLFKEQVAERTRITRANGNYLYLVYSDFTKSWYWIDSYDLDENATWSELEPLIMPEFPEVKE